MILGICATLVSIVTYQFFGNFWVKFGILHCILACCLLSIFVPRLSTLRFVFIFAFLIFLNIYLSPPNNVPENFDFIIRTNYPHFSVDYQPIFPMITVFYLGMLLSRLHFRKKPSLKINIPLITSKTMVNALIFMGRNSLIIYLVHQPVLFGCLKGYVYILR